MSDKALTPKQERFIQEYLRMRDVSLAALTAGFDLIQCGSETRFYVYLLTDSRNGEIFYVGKGKGKRYAHHEREWKSSRVVNVAKCQRIGEIKQAGDSVVAYRFADRLTEDAAFALERYVIRTIGVASLTNESSGFTTEHQKAMFKAQAALCRIKPYETWLEERPHKSVDPGIYWKIVEEFRYIASGQFMKDIEACGGAVV